MVNICAPRLPDGVSSEKDLKRLKKYVSSKKIESAGARDLEELLSLVEELESREDFSGFHKWFVPGTPYAMDMLPKHRAFMRATKDYREIWALGGNRTGKTRIGGTLAAVFATGQYPSWWEGRVFPGPTNGWVVGKTGQTVRDTIQETLLGPIGSIGTGAIPKESIISTTASPGIPGAVENIQVKHVLGGVSNIGIKSYKQDTPSFFGTARDFVWLDEPCPELIYNECLIRTMTGNGIVLHTITPKEGLTRLLANYLSDCDLLGGSEGLPNIDAIKAIMESENSKVSQRDG